MIEPSLSPSPFNVLQLPQDVQLSILLAFDIRELVICKQLCRSLANLVDGDISIQYKLELTRCGRIDGVPSAAFTVADRLASLREHRARFHASDHPLVRMRGVSFGSLSALSSNGFVSTVAGGCIHLRRPASTSSGMSKRNIIHTLRDLRLEGFETGSCVADVEQDLLVFSRHDLNARFLHCFIYSISKGRPHPYAPQVHMVSRLGPDAWPDFPSVDSMQILGDLIAWNAPNVHARRCDMRVVNWKTGVTVWECYGELWWCCRLISQSHAVLVTFESLLVYPIDRHRRSPSTPSTSDTAFCTLQLPAWSNVTSSHSLLVRSYIQFPPPLGPNDRPHYRHDPDLTLLTLDVRYIVYIPDEESEYVQYATFIPISTIEASVKRLAPFPLPPGGSPHLVPWNDWGRTGTRVVHLDSERPCYFSPMGCSCAVTQRRLDPSGNLFLRVLVFDVHPGARPDPQHAEEQSKFGPPTERDTLAGPAFTASVRTSFPFDVTRRDISLEPGDRFPTVVLTEDGLVLVTSPTAA